MPEETGKAFVATQTNTTPLIVAMTRARHSGGAARLHQLFEARRLVTEMLVNIDAAIRSETAHASRTAVPVIAERIRRIAGAKS